MNLIEYMPPFLKDVREFKVVFSSEDVELNLLKDKIGQVLDEVIVNKAEKYGLERYEKIYAIENVSNDIEVRRFNLLSKINNRIPFTRRWLINKLNNTVGEGNYIIKEDYNNYKISIEVLAIFEDVAEILSKDLREQLPANIEVTVNLFQTEECTSYFAGIVRVGDFMNISQEV